MIYRTFFLSFGTVHGDQHPATSYYKRVQHHWEQYRLYASFQALGQYAQDESKKHSAFLAQHGFHPAHAVRTQSLTMSYLARAIGLKKGQLQNVLQQSQCMIESLILIEFQ
jgi:hypothetical protein